MIEQVRVLPARTSAMKRLSLFRLGLSLAANVLLCCTLLPFILPPFEGPSFSELLEVLLWQSIGMVGWPLAILGLILSLASGSGRASTAPLVLMLLYPAIQFLSLRSIMTKTPHRLDVILLHIFVILSFVVMWYYVLNGYDFMTG